MVPSFEPSVRPYFCATGGGVAGSSPNRCCPPKERAGNFGSHRDIVTNGSSGESPNRGFRACSGRQALTPQPPLPTTGRGGAGKGGGQQEGDGLFPGGAIAASELPGW